MSNNKTDRAQFILKSGNKELHLGQRTVVMGIINCTPDSFFGGSRYNSVHSALNTALEMIEDGAEIIDIGGESTRPGSDPIPEFEEIERIIPVIQALRKVSPVWISVDTYKSSVARAALDSGADIINDISGLRFDSRMPDTAAHYNVPVIVMHILGEPKNMQKNPVYTNVTAEIYSYFEDRIRSLMKGGINPENIIIDPGIGFGKTTEHNLRLLNGLEMFGTLQKPILIGPSRKSFIGSVLNLAVGDRLEGTAAAVCVSIIRGAHIVRVHDVKAMTRVVRVTDAIMQSTLSHCETFPQEAELFQNNIQE